MNFLRLASALIAASCWLPGCLLSAAPVPAPSATQVAPPFVVNQPASADLLITMKNGSVVAAKAYLDGQKVRADLAMNGMQMTTILRPDEQKIYQVMPAQKMVMALDYDRKRFKEYASVAAAFSTGANFELIGPEIADGIKCIKYKVSAASTPVVAAASATPAGTKPAQVFYFWLDAAHKVPVKIQAANGSLTIDWKSYQPGPQAASLFEVPAGYQVMTMSDMPGGGMPGSDDSMGE